MRHLLIPFVCASTLCLGLASACSSEPSVYAEPTSGAGGQSSSSQGGAAAGGSATGGDSTTGTDAQGITVSAGAGGDGPTGCQKVDFLFVIDNSVSMQKEQEALIASFPGFISSIQATLKAKEDYHVLVADTDAWGKCKTGTNGCKNGSLCKEDNAYICNATFDTCDKTMGAGVVHPAGKGATNQICMLEGGRRYIQKDEPDINAAFACTAQVGLAGDAKERPMEAMVAAVSPELNAADACNDGFIRDDALLVITFITDESGNDSGKAQDWYDAVVSAKKGNPASVVVIGFIPTSKPKHFVDFIELWGDKGFLGEVNESDFSTQFASALTIIDEACDDFESPK